MLAKGLRSGVDPSPLSIGEGDQLGAPLGWVGLGSVTGSDMACFVTPARAASSVGRRPSWGTCAMTVWCTRRWSWKRGDAAETSSGDRWGPFRGHGHGRGGISAPTCASDHSKRRSSTQ